uniref:Uncharacterized protein n=1 Tax=Shewanella decolorationis TaxID=256839 RepID=A0A5B8R247_9GAMM
MTTILKNTVNQETLLLHFGDVVFKDLGQDIALREIQAELGSIQKRIGHNFASLAAFRTKKEEVGIEFILSMPIMSCLVVDHLHFNLKHFLNGSLNVLNILKNLGYETMIHYILEDRQSNGMKPSVVNTTRPVAKKERCFSCDGYGRHSRGQGQTCSICHGSGIHPEVTAKKRRENSKSNTVPVSYANKPSVDSYAYNPIYVDYDNHHIEDNAMHDDNLSDYSAEMGHDGDDY